MRPVLEYAAPPLDRRPYSETGGPDGEHPETCLQAHPRLGEYIIPPPPLQNLSLSHFAVKCSTSGKFSGWISTL